MNELNNFTFEGNQVRTLSLEETPYFLANDVAKILGYKRVGDAIKQHVDADNRKTLSYKAFGDLAQSLWAGNDFSNKTIITEAGVYDLIFGSDLPDAKKFKHWVTHEVLPSIRKPGGHIPKPSWLTRKMAHRKPCSTRNGRKRDAWDYMSCLKLTAFCH